MPKYATLLQSSKVRLQSTRILKTPRKTTCVVLTSRSVLLNGVPFCFTAATVVRAPKNCRLKCPK
jgi:hypothetical protein